MLSNLKNIADKVNKLECKQEFNLQNINIEFLKPSSKNIYGIREVEELAQDIKENGLYHNLVVRDLNNNEYEIISGERRFHALKSLGYKKIPCQVRNDLNDIDSEIMLIQANAKTRELNHNEKMKQIERLKALIELKRQSGEKVEGKTRDLIGKQLGISGVQVGRYLKINNELIPELKELLNKNELTMSKADHIAAMEKEDQMVFYEMLKEQNIKDIGREEIKKLKDDLNKQKQQFQTSKEDQLKIISIEREKLKEERGKGVHGEHLSELKATEWNMHLNILIQNLKSTINSLNNKLENRDELLTQDNIEALDSIRNNEINLFLDTLSKEISSY